MLGIVTVMVLLPGMMMAPIAHSMGRARKVHDSIRVGMTVPEVADASRDCDLFGAGSESVSDDHAVDDSVPPMSLSRNRDGTHWGQRGCPNRNASRGAPASEAARRLPLALELCVHQHDSDARFV
jgi:hypothetical protein